VGMSGLFALSLIISVFGVAACAPKSQIMQLGSKRRVFVLLALMRALPMSLTRAKWFVVYGNI